MRLRLLLLFSLVGLRLSSTDAVAQDAQHLSAKELFRQASRSVLRFDTFNSGGQPVSQGSAVVVEQGFVVTNFHVASGGHRFTVENDLRRYEATRIFCQPGSDLCVFAVQGLNAPPLELRSFAEIEIGERVYAIGTPKGLSLTLTEGLVSGKRDFQESHFVQTSAPVSPGSSGGGLFDDQGRLVGVTTFAIRESQNLNFAIPGDAVQAFLDRACLEVLVENHLQARGGRVALSRVQTVRQEGRATFGEYTLPFLIEWRRPSLYRLDLWLSGQQTSQGFDGTDVWVLNPSGLKTGSEVNPEDRWAVIDSAKHFLDQISLNSRPHVQFLGVEAARGKPAYKIKLLEEGGNERLIYLDASSYLELVVIRSLVAGNRSMRATMGPLEHGAFGGIVFPTKIKVNLSPNASDVPSEMLFEVRSLEVNRALDDYRFVVPSTRNAERIETSRELHRLLDQLAARGGGYFALSDAMTRASFIRYLELGANPHPRNLSARILKEKWNEFRARATGR